MKNKKNWWALYTKPRHEKKAKLEIEKKGITVYLPLNRVLRQWSDRKKWIEEPLFPGYIFIHGDAVERHQAVQSNGVV